MGPGNDMQSKRRPNRLARYDYSAPGAYFVTLCTRDRACVLGSVVGASMARPPEVVLTEYGKAVRHAILSIPAHYPNVGVDHYVIMPNHVHLLLRIGDADGRAMLAPTVSRMVQQMKGYVTKVVGRALWQRSYYDHVVRGRRDYEAIWRYIDTNPARWVRDRFYTE